MAEKYGVIRLDNVGATTDGSLLRSLRDMGDDGITEKEFENGSAVILDGLLPGEREAYKGITPTADDKGMVAIVCSPEQDAVTLSTNSLKSTRPASSRFSSSRSLMSRTYFRACRSAGW